MTSLKSNSSSKLSGKFTLLLIALIFFLTMTTYAYNEVIRTPQDTNGDASVIRILMNSMKSSEEREKLLLINVEQQNDTQKLLATIVSAEEAKTHVEPERKAREASVGKPTEKTKNSTQTLELANGNNREHRGYYEEQRAVVVHAESATPILAQRQPPYGPPSDQDSDERPLQSADPYYGDEGDYPNDSDSYYQRRPEERYYSDSREQYASAEERQEQQQQEEGEELEQRSPVEAEQDEARSTQQRQYDAYYRQWHYATTPAPIGGNRKLQPMRASDRNRDPYANYAEDLSDYDYRPQQLQQAQKQQPLQQFRPQQPRPQPPAAQPQKARPTSATGAATGTTAEPTYLTMVKSVKTMWDIYQAFSSAWNAIAEHRQKQLDQQQQQQIKRRQQMTRLNSRKPPKFESDEKSDQKTNNNTTKATKTTKASTTTKTTTVASSVAASSTTVLPPAKNEPRKGAKGDAAAKKDASGFRMRRASSDESDKAPTEVAEGRYIKGDPLKGYYDFVITEGSYKFWAVFQVGTALLIIYSTFAAIYYSKVNPLVSDYDYTDYLGGSRSLGGGDLDFVDDGEEGGGTSVSSEATAPTKAAIEQNWYEWGTRAGHSLKFILNAIDQLPGEEHVQYEAAKEQSGEAAEVGPHA